MRMAPKMIIRNSFQEKYVIETNEIKLQLREKQHRDVLIKYLISLDKVNQTSTKIISCSTTFEYVAA